MFRRIAFWVLTNIAVIAVIMTIVHIFGLETNYLSAYGIDYKVLAIFALLWGMVGSFVSLLLSKPMAKWSMKLQVIESPQNQDEAFILQKVQTLAEQAGIGMPEVAIYESGEVNAFATGARKNAALVAVSTGLLDVMDRDEVEGVLAHEVAHIANGDMITMALIQGVVNAFVIFFARIAAFAVQKFINRGDENAEVGGLVYFALSIVFEIIFSILASVIVAYFSRWREYRADSGGALYAGKAKMIAALRKLQKTVEAVDTSQKSLATMKISDRPSSFMALFSTHPDLSDRIAALEQS